MTSRRQFIQIVPVAGAALLASRGASAQDMVADTDAQAKALGYVGDAAKADKAKGIKEGSKADMKKDKAMGVKQAKGKKC